MNPDEMRCKYARKMGKEILCEHSFNHLCRVYNCPLIHNHIAKDFEREQYEKKFKADEERKNADWREDNIE
jgi:hypothetical protein